MKLTIRTLLAIAAFSTLATAASTLTYSFGSVANSEAPPSGPAPWATASFVDVNTNSVQLNLVLSMLTSEFVSKMAFNFGEQYSDSDFSFSTISTTGTFQAPTLSVDENSLNMGVGSRFDFGLNFATSNAGGGTKLFNGNDSISYLITYTGTKAFGVAAFDALDVSNQFKAIAHFQSIGTKNTSAWVVPATVIPEPRAALLGGLGLIALLRRRRA
jgi:hypothetical protein